MLLRQTADEETEEELLQAKAEGGGPLATEAEAASVAIAQGGRPLSPAERAYFEPRFGRDFSDVRVHDEPFVHPAVRAINARAFTLGTHIAFGRGEYRLETPESRRLLAHELAHTIQQRKKSDISTQTLQRQQSTSAETETSEQRATKYKQVRMRYNGTELIVYGDGRELFRYSADSGRPVRISRDHAEQCGADQRTDTYLNDARFVGIKDFGPIPEGTYRFSPPSIQRFTTSEQIELLVGGITGTERVRVSGGRSVHAGDWGAGRVALNPVRREQGPCGDTRKRSEFFLHGGILRGSSGCIDIGSKFDELADFLRSYPRAIALSVAYETGPTSVGFFTGFGGALAYSGFGFRHGPTLRLGGEFGQAVPGFVLSSEYQAILDWAGGALSAGVHVDIPMNDQEAFVRAGLRGGAEFRILEALYGRLLAGGFIESAHSGLEATGGAQLGGGLRYDFGRIQLDVLYNVLLPVMNEEEAGTGTEGASLERRPVHQALLGLGFYF
jgi:hypothetical protein